MNNSVAKYAEESEIIPITQVKQEETGFKVDDDDIDNKKVFSSEITRGQKPLQNDLYDLVKVLPATPTIPKSEKERITCNFQPNTEKKYVPKKRNRSSKVRTVKDIRRVYEADILPDLSENLEKQQKLLYKKITAGSAREDNTKALAKNMMKCDTPISRSSWQMLMTLNPEGHAHAIQYVLWNGRRIRVNGSKGGKNNFLCNYDLAKQKIKHRRTKTKNINKKLGLIQNSLAVKFKPGPLSKKKLLDVSFQKYNLGDTELVPLPKLGLEFQPTYGVPLERNIANLVQNLRNVDGTISEKWAEFAVSVLGTLNNSVPIKTNEESGVTFELTYNCNRQKMLMRRDLDSECWVPNCDTYSKTAELVDTTSDGDIKTIIDQMIDSIEISLQQDNMYTGEDESRQPSIHEDKAPLNNTSRDKSKKRFSELDRLDVTIIRLPEAPEITTESCENAHCSWGCVCGSLKCEYNLKQHCGRLDCMFECKCDFSKYKAVDSLDGNCPGLIPGLINLDNELSLKLAKEEQKFHQTIVMTGEKSILLKPERRNWKSSKRYSEFYRSMSLKNAVKDQQTLSVIDVKLALNNVEPWCMVHNLYKCFCKGKFTHDDALIIENNDIQALSVDEAASISSINTINTSRPRPEPRITRRKTISDLTTEDEITHYDLNAVTYSTCARITPFKKRKFLDSYYMQTNQKILEMEQNDVLLRKRMLSLIYKTDINVTNDQSNMQNEISSKEIMVEETKDEEGYCSENTVNKRAFNDTQSNIPFKISKTDTNTENKIYSKHDVSGSSSDNTVLSATKATKINSALGAKSILDTISNKTKLISWLETSYKQYKERILSDGFTKKSLEPPKHGKVALYPWQFILSRYRERKNLFMVSKQKPFRIFMAIDTKNKFFENCININDIRFADLHQYPLTIKNLLTNATDLNDNFCILCGLANCWELIGSVTKVTNQLRDSENDSELEKKTEDEHTDDDSSREAFIKENNAKTTTLNPEDKYKFNINPVQSEEEEEDETEKLRIQPLRLEDEKETNSKLIMEDLPVNNHQENPLNTESKWFVMTIENDFSEIQFYNRGFFVKYESIIKAINVARMSGKTVRLSSQKCGEQSNGPQFGIYAIPNANEYYVFVGPYDKDEPLGIETIKSISDISKPATTRGVWITTKKVDNVKVIDNPLSFMPPKDILPSHIIPIQSENIPKADNKCHETIDHPGKISTTKKKSIKPIKICKTNGFYHLAPGRLEKSLLKKHLIQTSVLPSTSSSLMKKQTQSLPAKATSTNEAQCNKPIAEIAPQIKIVNVFSTSDVSEDRKRPEGGMFILKPEEINKRLMESKFTPITSLSHENETNAVIEKDIENFISNSVECTALNTDSFIISDDEDNLEPSQSRPDWKEIWIECLNNVHLGWLRGRKNRQNQISFEFPGFFFTDFYDTEEEVFSKINQVLSRKIYVPRSIKLEWHIVENADNLKGRRMLSEDLGADFVLTKRGLRHKRDLIANSMSLKASSSEMKTPRGAEVDKVLDAMNELEEKGKKLDDQTDLLIGKLQRLRSNATIIPKQEENSDTFQNVFSD